MTDPESVIWHDLECGTYAVDLGVWRELADRHAGAILDVGAGSGRVALDLARAGHAVTALDHDGQLLAALERRGAGLPVQTVCADARTFTLDGRFGLCIVPMQTVQLLEGSRGRRAFLARVGAHLGPAGVVAMAIADHLEPFDVAEGFPPPVPDVTEIEGTVYCSRPTAVRLLDETRYRLDRTREIVSPAGELTTVRDEITLDFVTPEELEQDGRAAGLTVLPRRLVPETEEYVGSTVVMLGG